MGKYIKKRDYDIRLIVNSMFEDYCKEGIAYEISANLNDKEILRLANEFLKESACRLDNDLDNEKIAKEYYKLVDLTEEIDKIIENYV